MNLRGLVGWILAGSLVGCSSAESAPQAQAGAAGAAGAVNQGGSTGASGESGQGGAAAGQGGATAGQGGAAAGMAGAAGQGGSCPPGSHQGDGVCETTLGAWTKNETLLKVGRDHHVTFVAHAGDMDYLYVGPGLATSAIVASFERAAILADGTLGPLTKAETPPSPTIGPGLAQIGDHFVMIGGLDDTSNSTRGTTVGVVQPDGALVFSAGSELNVDRYHIAAAVSGDRLFATGGLVQKVSGSNASQDVSDAVETARLVDGVLSAWTLLGPYPHPVSHASTFVHGGYLYVAGGITNAKALPDIQRAPITDEGLGAWEAAGTLPEGRATSAATVFLDHVYLIGGATLAQGGEVSTVLRAPLSASGVGEFTELASLPKARAHAHQAPVFQNLMFSVGGSIDHKGQKEIFVARLE